MNIAFTVICIAIDAILLYAIGYVSGKKKTTKILRKVIDNTLTVDPATIEAMSKDQKIEAYEKCLVNQGRIEVVKEIIESL